MHSKNRKADAKESIEIVLGSREKALRGRNRLGLFVSEIVDSRVAFQEELEHNAANSGMRLGLSFQD